MSGHDLKKLVHICAMVKSRCIGDGHPIFNRNPYNGYINPYYWVDDHPLLYRNNGSLDPGTYDFVLFLCLAIKIRKINGTIPIPWVQITPSKYQGFLIYQG